MSFIVKTILSCLILTKSVFAADISVQVMNKHGKPVENAVVYAEPTNKSLSPPVSSVSIVQKNKTFIPLVSVAQVGTQIQFPNQDSVKHHVYSFSPAKTFELKLYSGAATKSIVFDKEGTVVLGCNIHDNMLAYVQIVDTPYFAKTDATGAATIKDLPKGKYKLKAWHFSTVKENEIFEKPIEFNTPESFQITLDTKPI